MIFSHTSTIYILRSLSLTSYYQIYQLLFLQRNPFPRCESNAPRRQIGICQKFTSNPQTNISTSLNHPATHASNTKQSIPFDMALRLRRICSTNEFFNTRSGALTTHLMKRGYIHSLVNHAIEEVRQIPRSRALETSVKKESHRIQFVVRFNPALPNIY